MAGMNTARSRAELGRRVEGLGEWIALAGVVLPLLLIGLLKFTRAEIEALRPLITGTPWLAWLYPALGEAGASYLLGVVEITTGCLFLASQWSWRAGLAAGALGTLTFATTVKDVALLGISVTVLGRSLSSATGSSLFARQAIAR